MGVHESNKGLCEALHRMFIDLKCVPALSGDSGVAPAGGAKRRLESQVDECKRIAERFVARECAPVKGEPDLAVLLEQSNADRA